MLTDGRFTITNYPEGSLCAANQLFDYVQNGTIQCGGDWGGYEGIDDSIFPAEYVIDYVRVYQR